MFVLVGVYNSMYKFVVVVWYSNIVVVVVVCIHTTIERFTATFCQNLTLFPGGDKGPTEHTATACIYLEAMGISKLRVGLWPAVGTICIIHSNEPAEQLSKFPYRKVKKPPSATSPIRQLQRVCGS